MWCNYTFMPEVQQSIRICTEFPKNTNPHPISKWSALVKGDSVLSLERKPVLTTIQIKLLTHWGRVKHICISKLTIIGSDNGLSPDWRQAIIWTNAGLLLIGPLGTNFSEILIQILTFSFKKMHLKVPSVKRRPFCLGLNVLSIPAQHIHDKDLFIIFLAKSLLT